jgi:sugar phosphate isomerase/epimerase
MRLAVSNIAWEPSEDDAVAAILRAEEVDAVELAPTKYWPAPAWPRSSEVEATRIAWRARGQQVVALQSLLFGRPELSIFDAPGPTAVALRRVLAIASGLGAKVLVFGSPRNRDRGARDWPRAVAGAAAFFRPLAEAAAPLGCVLALEPNPTAYGCNFATTTAEALEVVRAVDHPGFGLHLDVGILHLNGEDPARAIELARPHLAHVHISEPQLAAVSEGPVDHPRAAAALRLAGWEGGISIEMRADPAASNPDRVRRAVAFAREIYR